MHRMEWNSYASNTPDNRPSKHAKIPKKKPGKLRRNEGDRLPGVELYISCEAVENKHCDTCDRGRTMFALQKEPGNVTIITTNHAKVVFSYSKAIGVYLFDGGKGYRLEETMSRTTNAHMNKHCRDWEKVDPATFATMLEKA